MIQILKLQITWSDHYILSIALWKIDPVAAIMHMDKNLLGVFIFA